MIIGVTGRSGSGKSSFSNILKNRGFVILDADEIVKKLYSTNEVLLLKIRKIFPEAFERSFLDVKKLAEIVFSEVEKLLVLSEIVNPFVLEVIRLEIKKNINKNIVIDAITLFESGVNILCDKTVAVIANNKLCVKRIVKRDKISRDMAIKRLNCQPDYEFYKKRVDFYFENIESFEFFKEKVEYILTLWNIS